MTLLKGALVSYSPTFSSPKPNVTVFQYNPESLTHTWTQSDAPSDETTPGAEAGNPLAVAGMPGERFSLTVLVDANQELAGAGAVEAEIAAVSGVYSRLAALEMLLYPVSGGAKSQLLGRATAALQSAGGGTKGAASESTLPVVLFVWGPLRIVPVRVTGLTISEKLYDEQLNPVHAEVQLELRVLTPAELQAANATSDVLARLATTAYSYTLGVRQAGALANLSSARGPIAELP